MRSELLALTVSLVVAAPAARAADVEELFSESLFAGKIDVDMLGSGQLDDSRCWGQDGATGELLCVLFERKGEAVSWQLAVYEPGRAAVERLTFATRADDYADVAKGAKLAAANAAAKRRKWRPLDSLMQVAERADGVQTAAAPGGRTLRAEGKRVELREGAKVVATLALGEPGAVTHVTLYAARGEVVSLQINVGKGAEVATLAPFGQVGLAAAVAPQGPGKTCKSCPAAWAELAPLMDKLCQGAFGEPELAALKGHVAAGRLDKDEVARLWNTVGAMTGFVFKKYPQWNALFHGEDQAHLPAACKPWLEEAHKEGALPAGIRAGRDRIRAYWKTL